MHRAGAVASIIFLSSNLAAAEPEAPTQDPPVSDDTTEAPAADDARSRARELFRLGTEAHEEGRFEEAAKLFEQAHRTAPHASVKFNAGIAWDSAGQSARAADAYETSLEMGGLTQEEAAEANERLTALKRTLGYLRIDEPVGALVWVAHLERATVPVRLHVTPGEHGVRVETSDGRSTKQTVRVGAGDVVTVDVNLGEPKKAPEAQASFQTPAPAPAPPPVPDAPAETASSSQATWGWIALGTGVALSGAAVVLGLSALSARDEYDESENRDVDARDRAASLRTWTNVAWGGAAVTGGVGLYLVLTTPKVEF